MPESRWFAFVLTLLCSGLAFPKSIDNIRLGFTPERTRVVFDLSEPAADYRVIQQSSGLLVEFEGFELAFDPGKLSLGGTPISGIDSGQSSDGTLHIFVALQREVVPTVFTLGPNETRGNRLAIDLNLAPSDQDNEATQAALPAAVASSAALDDQKALAGPSVEPSTRQARAPAGSGRVRFDGTWEQEWAIETDDVDNQKFEALIEPRMEFDLLSETTLTAIARIRLDAVGDLGPDENRPDSYSSINGAFFNDAYGEVSLRELYVDTRWGETYWRVGKQQVVWGQADGIKVLDVVNPQSYREFILDDFDDSRIPLSMVNLEVPVAGDATLQLLWITDPTYHELAEPGSPYFLTSPLLVPVAQSGVETDVLDPDTPENLFEDSDIGGRLSAFVGGWDLTVNYLYHYQDFPAFYQDVNVGAGGPAVTITPEYERNHLVGGTLSNVFGDFTVRSELVYNSDTFHVSSNTGSQGVSQSSEFASVLGLDWQLGEYDTLLSFQWFQSYLLEYRDSIYRDEIEHVLSGFYQKSFKNETWLFDALFLYSANNEDSSLQMKLNYLFSSNIEIWVGADIFSGSKKGLFGQFRDEDRVLIGLELGF